MAYSERQKTLLRERLHAYRYCEEPGEEGNVAWADVVKDMKDELGHTVQEEALRRFAEGITKRPRAAVLDPIFEFLKSVGYLAEAEMHEEAAPYHAAFALMSFFGQEQPGLDPSGFAGTFKSDHGDNDERETVTLNIETEKRSGLVRVHEVSAMYSKIGNQQKQIDEIASVGWAVYHPQGMFMLFLREPVGMNVHCYAAMASHPQVGETARELESIALYRYEQSVSYPPRADDFDDPVFPVLLRETVSKIYNEDTLFFERAE